MNEAQTRRDLIDPAIEAAGWTKENGCRILDEQSAVQFAPGKVGRVRGKPLSADYVLTYRGRRLVVIEAKRDEVDASLGFDQAVKYGNLLGMTAAYATNGKEIYEMDLKTGGATPVKAFASPEEIWKRAFPNKCGWRDTFTAEPFWFNAVKKVRYYQELAGDEPENVFVLPLDADGRPICEPFLVSHGTADVASVVGIRLQDHIVISGDRHVSIRESGLVDFGEK